MYYAYARKVPATSTLGARIRVKVDGGTVSVPYDHGASDPFAAAIQAVVGSGKIIEFDKRISGAERYTVTEEGEATPDNPDWQNPDGTTNHAAIAREWE